MATRVDVPICRRILYTECNHPGEGMGAMPAPLCSLHCRMNRFCRVEDLQKKEAMLKDTTEGKL